jgi:hypothetical protein
LAAYFILLPIFLQKRIPTLLLFWQLLVVFFLQQLTFIIQQKKIISLVYAMDGIIEIVLLVLWLIIILK